VEEGIAARTTATLVERASLLGLPLGALGEVTATEPVVRTRLGDADPLDEPPVVVDLSSLWAGPLCGRLLLERGARVIKVESATRPDGADLYERMNAGKEVRRVDLRAELPAILAEADVVIEASRPRALQQLGIDAATVEGPRVWVSITGYGRASNRVGFGDDCAVAGGLVDWADDGTTPQFVGDAVADPLTGVAAAAAATQALQAGGRWLLDVALARVAASVSIQYDRINQGDVGGME
jgi:crotonobetainyl-CoA:carnitine CoA-transferase CaiB-like acyl-CoA transferase